MLAERYRRTQGLKDSRTQGPRRGVTLVEMLVTVAVLVIMMTILVQIFQAATGSVSAAHAYQQLDDQLRRIDTIIRADLEGVTAKFTPPLDPAQNLGYFEYGENEFADNQGEDGDDYIRFTAKAPAGKPFTGRFWANYANGFSATGTNQPQPITITSDYAEIIYFVRNGNLYRRILLIAPEMQPVLNAMWTIKGQIQAPHNNLFNNTSFIPTVFGNAVSWQGVNDLSARPSATGHYKTSNTTTTSILLNTLGDLTNRENRFAYPRFANDFQTVTANGTYTAGSDGIPDDTNSDNIPDLYPSLYPNLFAGNATSPALIFAPGYTSTAANNLLAFPYVFPGAYSKAQSLATDAYGWIHAPAPLAVDTAGNPHRFDTAPWLYLQNLNHNPLDMGDNLPTPLNAVTGAPLGSDWQTWWGFPTWRESLSPNWWDPTHPLWLNHAQPPGLQYAALNLANGHLTPTDPNLLPPMRDPGNLPVNFSVFRASQQPFCEAAGQKSYFWSAHTNPPAAPPSYSPLWPLTWEDDLIMTNVRSFDVKAYDNTLANYADLGWGDDLRMYIPYSQNPGNTTVSGAIFINVVGNNNTLTTYQNTDLINNPPVPPPYLNGTAPANPWPPVNPQTNPNTPIFSTLQTFAHEGRMPPLIEDNRLDAQYGDPTTYLPPNSPYLPKNKGPVIYTGNIGDDTPGIVRLRRVWDTWSTAYSQAPGTGVSTAASGQFPTGPPYAPPVYPSYPPPYPAPLRGLQIQIRVADPTNQRIKSLTIRQDFTDKL